MTEAELIRLIRHLLPRAATIDDSMLDRIVQAPGAYALLLHLDPPVRFARNGMAATSLAGWHVYAGSARGSGGIRARLRRHFRPDKAIHWHVDELTNAAAQMSALAITDGSECEIVERLLQSGLFEPALAGFGSSDCKHCTAHLLRPVSE